MDEISSLHPRAESLRVRKKLVDGFKMGLVVEEGLAAHGRGEAFDYLLSERTTREARRAIKAAAAALLLAERPVISVNGNAAALVPEELVELSRVTGAKLEVNLFHGSRGRERAIARWLRQHGASEVLGVDPRFYTRIREVHSQRRKVDRRGIAAADVVLVPLEDGDRTEALKRLGKRVIAIDLNPMSRTARAADITIVDNIVRAMPLLVAEARRLSKLSRRSAEKAIGDFDNDSSLRATYRLMQDGLRRLAETGTLRR
ncbi:MAG: phosphopantothenate/pantothenate synthetase [Candidatus Hadarchaeum sp.]|uniref:phosphopantothenate/pantothenate synthetase n=1 Tax=Candidatus Hadarchaeum sp. TaxID=2883567 RepID=UPI0031820269